MPPCPKGYGGGAMPTDDNAASVRARAREPGMIQTKDPRAPAAELLPRSAPGAFAGGGRAGSVHQVGPQGVAEGHGRRPPVTRSRSAASPAHPCE
ncbi:hypothetical protein GCM10010271_52360 [Streptomyces kurssanovii]|nr:hypothetical protein GCM10010271_52360 [Streptomyces kurssanovii]